MNWEIRLGTMADFADIWGLFQLVDGLHHDALPSLFRSPAEINRDESFLADWLADEDGRLWVVEENSRVIGLIFAKYYEKTHPFVYPHSEIYIHEMVVAEGHQGSGMAQMLMAKVVEWANVKKVNRVRLQVFEFNQRAQAFYAKQGFETSSRYMWLKIGD